jgi:hypothetical protein
MGSCTRLMQAPARCCLATSSARMMRARLGGSRLRRPSTVALCTSPITAMARWPHLGSVRLHPLLHRLRRLLRYQQPLRRRHQALRRLLRQHLYRGLTRVLVLAQRRGVNAQGFHYRGGNRGRLARSALPASVEIADRPQKAAIGASPSDRPNPRSVCQ